MEEIPWHSLLRIRHQGAAPRLCKCHRERSPTIAAFAVRERYCLTSPPIGNLQPRYRRHPRDNRQVCPSPPMTTNETQMDPGLATMSAICIAAFLQKVPENGDVHAPSSSSIPIMMSPRSRRDSARTTSSRSLHARCGGAANCRTAGAPCRHSLQRRKRLTAVCSRLVLPH